MLLPACRQIYSPSSPFILLTSKPIYKQIRNHSAHKSETNIEIESQSVSTFG